MATPKIVIKMKPKTGPTKKDLRSSSMVASPTPISPKQLIITVMTQLIDHTTDVIKGSIGEDKKRQQFRLTQFRKALASIKDCPTDITSGKQAMELPGIGKGIGDRIEEILRTGTLTELSQSKPIDEKTQILNDLMTITGIGEANAKKFVEQGVIGVDDLRNKVTNGTIRLTHHMSIGLKYHDDFNKKIPFQEIVELNILLNKFVHAIYPDVLVEVCGSHRRQKAVSGDIDVLMTCPKIVNDDDLIMSQNHYLKDIVKTLKDNHFIIDDLTSQGDTKYMGVCIHPNSPIGRRIDIRFVTYDSYYPAILYFTGSMTLNKLMRITALEKGFTLNEYGLYRLISKEKDEKIVVHSEEDIFEALNLVYLKPNERDL